jgi:hypothetical protein
MTESRNETVVMFGMAFLLLLPLPLLLWSLRSRDSYKRFRA